MPARRQEILRDIIETKQLLRDHLLDKKEIDEVKTHLNTNPQTIITAATLLYPLSNDLNANLPPHGHVMPNKDYESNFWYEVSRDPKLAGQLLPTNRLRELIDTVREADQEVYHDADKTSFSYYYGYSAEDLYEASYWDDAPDTLPQKASDYTHLPGEDRRFYDAMCAFDQSMRQTVSENEAAMQVEQQAHVLVNPWPNDSADALVTVVNVQTSAAWIRENIRFSSEQAGNSVIIDYGLRIGTSDTDRRAICAKLGDDGRISKDWSYMQLSSDEVHMLNAPLCERPDLLEYSILTDNEKMEIRVSDLRLSEADLAFAPKNDLQQ